MCVLNVSVCVRVRARVRSNYHHSNLQQYQLFYYSPEGGAVVPRFRPIRFGRHGEHQRIHSLWQCFSNPLYCSISPVGNNTGLWYQPGSLAFQTVSLHSFPTILLWYYYLRPCGCRTGSPAVISMSWWSGERRTHRVSTGLLYGSPRQTLGTFIGQGQATMMTRWSETVKTAKVTL